MILSPNAGAVMAGTAVAAVCDRALEPRGFFGEAGVKGDGALPPGEPGKRAGRNG